MRAKAVLREALFAIAPGAMLARAHRRFGASARREEAMIRALSRGSRTAIDVGANLGYFSRVLSETAARVVAFEPVPALAALLRRHLSPRVEVVEAAASDGSRATIELYVPLSHGDPIYTEASAEHRMGETRPGAGLTVEAASCSIDSLALGDVDFIKIDVEGHEEGVLAGATTTLAECRPALWIECEERHNPGGPERLFAALERLGYDGWFVEEGRLAPVAEFRADLQSEERRRQGPLWYVNNFAFVHRTRQGFDLLAALAAAGEIEDA